MREGLRVLVAEDDAMIGLAIHAVLADYRCDVLLAGGLDHAMKVADPLDTVDLAVVDLKLADGSGTGLIERLRALRPELPVIISTGYALGDVDRQVLDTGVGRTVVLEKPWTEAELIAAIVAATDSSECRRPSRIEDGYQGPLTIEDRTLPADGMAAKLQ
jgi:DNA-binding NtrC family response regulator